MLNIGNLIVLFDYRRYLWSMKPEKPVEPVEKVPLNEEGPSPQPNKEGL